MVHPISNTASWLAYKRPSTLKGQRYRNSTLKYVKQYELLAKTITKNPYPRNIQQISYFSNKPIDRLKIQLKLSLKFNTQPANHQPPTHPTTRPITFLSFHWTERDQILTIGIAQTSDYIPIKIKTKIQNGDIYTFNYIQIKIKMLTPHQESPTPYKAEHQVLKTMNVLYTSK